MSAPTFTCSSCFLTFQGYNTKCNICIASEKQLKKHKTVNAPVRDTTIHNYNQSDSPQYFYGRELSTTVITPITKEDQESFIRCEQARKEFLQAERNENIIQLIAVVGIVGLLSFFLFPYWKYILIGVVVLFALYISTEK